MTIIINLCNLHNLKYVLMLFYFFSDYKIAFRGFYIYKEVKGVKRYAFFDAFWMASTFIINNIYFIELQLRNY